MLSEQLWVYTQSLTTCLQLVNVISFVRPEVLLYDVLLKLQES